MKVITIFIMTLLTLVLSTANAQNVKRLDQYVKLPAGQSVIETQDFTNLAAASQGYVFASAAANTSAAAVVKTTGIVNPDSARNVTLDPEGATQYVNACTVVVAGTDILNHSITEDFVFAASAAAVVTGAKAFKTVTSVTFPADCEVSPYSTTWSLGVGEKIGLKRCMDVNADWLQSALNGTLETRATITASAGVVSANTADFVGSMQGSNDFKGYFLQNFQCY